MPTIIRFNNIDEKEDMWKQLVEYSEQLENVKQFLDYHLEDEEFQVLPALWPDSGKYKLFIFYILLLIAS